MLKRAMYSNVLVNGEGLASIYEKRIGLYSDTVLAMLPRRVLCASLLAVGAFSQVSFVQNGPRSG